MGPPWFAMYSVIFYNCDTLTPKARFFSCHPQTRCSGNLSKKHSVVPSGQHLVDARNELPNCRPNDSSRPSGHRTGEKVDLKNIDWACREQSSGRSLLCAVTGDGSSAA